MKESAIVRTIVKRPGAVLLLFFVLLIISIFMTGLIDFEQDIFKVFPQKSPIFKVLVHALKSSSAQDKLFLLVSGPDDSETLIREGSGLVRDLEAVRIDGKPAFKSVTFQKTGAFSNEEFQDLLYCFLKRPEFFLAQEDISRLSEQLSSLDALDDQIKRSLALLAVPGAQDLSGIIALDPLNLRMFLIEKLQSMHQGLEFASGPDLLSPDKKSLLIIASPAHPPGNHAIARLVMEEIDRIRAGIPSLEIGVTGGYAIAAQETALVRGDILACLLGSVLGVGLLFILIYRNPIVLCFILLPLGVGLQLALGVMSIVCSQIHLLATAFATVVLGLGIDFAVHVYDRYAMERQEGESPGTSVQRSIINTGSAVLAGCLTTLIAFLVLTLTGSHLLHQIAWLVSLGLLFCLVTILFALPAGLVWLEKRFNRRPSRSMLLLGTDRLGAMVAGRPWIFVIISFVVILVAFPGILRLRFEHDMAALRPQGLEALNVQENLMDAFDAGQQYALVSWTAEDIELFWEKGRAVDGALDELKKTGIVKSWSSLGRISSEKPPLLLHIDMGAINELFGKYGMALEHFQATHAFLAAISGTGSRAKDDSGSADLVTSCYGLDMFPDMFNRFFVCENDNIRGITWVMISGTEATRKLCDDLKRACDGLIIVNPSLAMAELVSEVKSELLITLGAASLLIIGILLVFFRKLSVLPYILMPVTMGIFVTAGIMGWAGVHLNPFNFIVLPILIGIGLDDGIHIFRRYQELGNIRKTLATTGRSVLVTTLTTVCGFGSLSLADYHVLQSMGIMAIVGVVACFVFSVVTLPAVLAIRDQ